MAEAGLRTATTFPAAVEITLSATPGEVTRVLLPPGKFRINVKSSTKLNGGTGTAGTVWVIYDQSIADGTARGSEAYDTVDAEDPGYFETGIGSDAIPHVSIGGDTASMHVVVSAERIG